MSKVIKPGTDNQKAGTYHEVGPRGGKVADGRVVNIVKVIAYRLLLKKVTVGQNNITKSRYLSSGIFFDQNVSAYPKMLICNHDSA